MIKYIKKWVITMFELISKYKPAGDQPEAIKELVEGINEGKRDQVLLGATGTGKTFTIANVIEKINKPTLVLAHNKTLAGQLCCAERKFNACKYKQSICVFRLARFKGKIPKTSTAGFLPRRKGTDKSGIRAALPNCRTQAQ